MKKFFSLLAGTLVCVSAVAQEDVTTIYVAGAPGTVINGQTLGNWDIANPLEVEATDGYFVLDCKNVQQYGFGISDLKTSDWTVWPQHLYRPSAEFTKANLGKEVPMSGPNAGNFEPLWPGDWKLVISRDLSTVTVTTTTPGSSYNLVGSFNEYACQDNYQFEAEDGVDNVFWLDITTPLTSSILNILRNKGWADWWTPQTTPLSVGETANTWLWHDDWLDKSNPRDAALTDYTGTMRLEVPDDITNGCSIAVTCYPDIREHKSIPTGIVLHRTEYGEHPEYFNLQGMKVETPRNGIYVVRRGNKVTKELIR